MRAPRSILALALPLLALGACEGDDDDDAPAIVWTAVRPHEDRGECTRCHLRLDLNGNPVPEIPSWARMPHADRGVCTNCHRITRGDRRVATAGAARQVGWLGMDLAPLPGGDGRQGGGMLVTDVDGIAERAGVQPGDILLSVDGIPVGSPRDLDQVQRGRPAALQVARDGRVVTVAVDGAIQAAMPIEQQAAGGPRRF